MFKGMFGVKARYASSFLAVLVLVSSLLCQGAIEAPLQRPGVLDEHQGREIIERTYEVTLVTGDVVEVGITNASRYQVLAVRPADPQKLDRSFRIWEDGQGLYVVPTVLDVGRFDIELFDVKYLIEEGYWNQTYIPLIITVSGADKEVGQSDIEQRVTAKGAGKVKAKYKIVPAVSAMVSVQAVSTTFSSLVSSFYVEKVWLDRKVNMSLCDSVPLIGADDVWALGYDGTGVKIAILDTGIDSTHPDLAGRVAVSVDFTDDSNVDDLFGHGTHCASIAAGTGAASGGLYRGVAPSATLWNVKVLDRYGSGYDSWIISGIQFAAYGPDGTASTGDEADILSLSLGANTNNNGTDPLSLAVDDAVANAGRVVVVAAGNNGYGNYYTVGTPGTAREAITVGASDKSDYLAWFSSLGPTSDLRVKPDILAPGVDIIAARAANGVFSPIPGNDYYTQLSGTSMATPHIAGVAALLKQEHPGWSAQDIKNALICSAVNLEYNAFQQGGGRVDALAVAQTGLIAEPATVSLGRLGKGTIASFDVSFGNIGASDLTTGLSFNLRDTLTGEDVSTKASLNVTSLTLVAGKSKGVRVTIDTVGLSASLYSGIVNTDYAAAGRSDVHVTFGFVICNKVVATVIGLSGNPVSGAWVYAFKSRSESYGFRVWNYTDDNGHANLYLFDGTIYTIGAGGVDSDVACAAYAVDKRDLFADTSITLDLRNAHKLSYRPPAPNQVMASVITWLRYFQSTPNPNIWFGLGFWTYYPLSSDIYCSSTDLNFTSYYQHYPREYMTVKDPLILGSPELYSILFARQGISAPEVFTVAQSDLAKIVRQYRVAVTPSAGAEITRDSISWYQVGWYTWGVVNWGGTWDITVPRTLVEWISPGVDYSVQYRKTSDAPNTATPYFYFYQSDYYEYASFAGEYVSPAGTHPLVPHIYVSCWSYDGGTLGSLSLSTDVFMDIPSFMTLWSDQGRIVLKRNGTTLVDTGWFSDSWGFSLDGLQLPARFEVKLYGLSGLRLSTEAYSELEFEVPVGGYFSLYPIITYIWIGRAIGGRLVSDLDSNNTHVAGDIQGLLSKAFGGLGSVTLRYSTDDGATWEPAELVSDPSGWFNFTIRDVSDAYVSLRVNGTFTDGTRFDQTITRGFYVKPAPPVSQPTVTIDDMFVDSGIIKINATILSPTRITGAQYAVDTTSSPTSVPAPLDGTYDSTDEKIHIEVDALSYAGLHKIYVRCFDADGYPGEWLILDFNVRDLVSRYNLISPTLSPPPGYSAFDISRAIGSAVTVVAKWDPAAQQYLSYVPGFSGSELDFPVESGYGYFVYLTSAGKLVEVSWP